MPNVTDIIISALYTALKAVVEANSLNAAI